LGFQNKQFLVSFLLWGSYGEDPKISVKTHENQELQAMQAISSDKIVSQFAVRRAQALLQEGIQAGANGLFDKAIVLFKNSLRLNRTAEGYTNWGWAEANKGNIHVAIHQCREALRIDPEFGNASNDIGSYLFVLGDVSTAITYLERAKASKNCTSRHFAMTNLGQIYRERGNYWRAYREYTQALEVCPGNQDISNAIAELRSRLS
jgi:tetratricopeptide (TPR) repeat protein